MIVLLLASLGPGCGGSMYDSPPKPEGEAFVAKGKLKAEEAAKAAGKKVPAR